MGRPAPEYAVTVVDGTTGRCGPGEPGELLVRGERGVSLFAEYLGDPDATARAFTDDGWFRTGDRVRWEESGALTFVERDKDVLKVGGENVGAPEIERVLRGVVGSARWPSSGGQTRCWARSRSRSSPWPNIPVDRSGAGRALRRAALRSAAPREVRVVHDLPRSTLDKVAKAQLRALLVEESAGA